MAEYATLAIQVDSKGVVTGTQSLKKLEQQGAKTEKTTKKLGASTKLLGGALAALATSALAANILAVNREFESLKTSLITTTGSVEDANIAFEGIKEFAATTPFAVAEVTNAFIKLGNLGLAPSEKALTSYGNTAGAMGKSLNQMIEAVADATTGEFERLKEFGIKTKTEGDRISFTFRGMTTEIGKNAGEIQDFLVNLGETEFAGGMERQASTLNGAISNLGDSWDSFVDNLMNDKNSSKVTSAIRFVGEGIDFINNLLNSSAHDVLLKQANDTRDQIFLLDEKIKEMTEAFGEDNDYVRNLEKNRKGLKELLDSLDAEVVAFSAKSKKSFDEIAESLNKVSADKNAAEALKDRYEELVKASDRFNKSLRTPVEIYNEEIAVLKELRNTRIEGSNAALISQETYNRGLIAAKETLDASLAKGNDQIAHYDDLITASERLNQSLRTPLEIYQDEIALLNELKNTRITGTEQALLSEENYIRGVKEAQDTLDASLQKTTSEFDKLTSAVDGWGASFADAMLSSSGSFTDFAENMINQLQRIALQQASQPIFDAFGGFLKTGISSLLGSFGFGGGGGGGGGGGFTNPAFLSGGDASAWASDLFPSASGGGFTGSGSRSGGVDGQGGFPAILHPNETVIDHSRGQSAGGGDVNVIVNVDASESNANGDQDGLALGRALGDAIRTVLIDEKRNGGLLA